VLTFAAGDVTASIDPVRGGRLASLVIDGAEVLVSRTDDALAWGAYPMVPFAGRIRRGRFRFDDVDRCLPVNLGPHAIHGYGFVSEWDVIDDHSIGLTLGEPWPFVAEVRQWFELTASSLTMTMTAVAHERQPMMLGWHPWFRRDIGVGHQLSLEFGAGRMYELDDEAIPTGQLVDPPGGPWDNCFTDISTEPVLRWGPALELRLSSTADHWVIFDEPTHAMCVEPQTDAPDAVNRGQTSVEAGATTEIRFSISW